MKRSEMMDMIEEKFLETQPGDFNSVDHALIVAASALQYLADQVDEVEDEVSEPPYLPRLDRTGGRGPYPDKRVEVEDEASS